MPSSNIGHMKAGDTGDSSKNMQIFDESLIEVYSVSFFSDHVHYLTKSTIIPIWIHHLLFYMFVAQFIVVALCPQNEAYWVNDLGAFKIVNLLGYCFLVRPPPVGSVFERPLLLVSLILIALELIVSLAVRIVYNNLRIVPRVWCYISRYTSLVMNTFLSPFIVTNCALLIRKAFDPNVENQNSAVVLLTFLLLLIFFARMCGFLLFTHYTISFSEQIFKVHRPITVMRIYLSLTINALLNTIFPARSSNIPVIPTIICVISFINLFIDFYYVNWAQENEFRIICAVEMIASFVALAVAIDNYCNWNHPDYIIWVVVGICIVCSLITPPVCNFITMKAIIRIAQPDYAVKVRSARQAHHDLCIGYCAGHIAALDCQHMFNLFERFPDDFYLCFYCARLSLTFNTCPYSMERLAAALAPRSAFSPLRSHVYDSVMRILSPTHVSDINKYERDIVAIHRMFRSLIGACRVIFEAIVDEIPAMLPHILGTFNHFYQQTCQQIFIFVQRYPSSPDAEFFLEVFETLFPGAPETDELKAWLDLQPEHVKQNLALFPKQMSALIIRPEIFRSYMPKYQNKKKLIPPVPGALSECGRKIRNFTGPHEYLLKKFVVFVVMALSIIFPVVTIPMIISQNEYYSQRTNQVVLGYTLLWRAIRTRVFMYPLALYPYTPVQKFWKSEAAYNIYRNDFLNNITEWQQDLILFSLGFGRSLGTKDKLMEDMSSLMIDEYFWNDHFNTNLSIYSALLTTSFVADEYVSNDSSFINPTQTNSDYFDINFLQKLFSAENVYVSQLVLMLNGVDLMDHNYKFISPTIFLVISIVLVVAVFVIIVLSFRTAISKFDLFFMTLRDTSKTAVSVARQYFRTCQTSIGGEVKTRQKKKYGNIFSFKFHLIIPLMFISLIQIMLFILLFLLNRCHVDQSNRYREMSDSFSQLYSNLTSTVSLVIIHTKNNTDVFNDSVVQEIVKIYNTFQDTIWQVTSPGSNFCPLCVKRAIYGKNMGTSGVSFEKIFYNFMTMMSMYTDKELFELDGSIDYVVNTLSLFYTGTEQALRSFVKEFTISCEDLCNKTVTVEYVLYGIYIVSCFIFLVFIIFVTKKADAPFNQMVKLLNRLPENALSKDTLKILSHNTWDFPINDFVFDSSYYTNVLQTLPDAVIILDPTLKVQHYNIAARMIIDTTEAAGKDLGEVTITNLVEDIDDQEQKEYEHESVQFIDLVRNYIFDGRIDIADHVLVGTKDNQKSWFFLNILPIFDDTSEVMASKNKTSDLYALIFRDIGDEKRQQSLVAEETRKHFQIVQQILPPQIAGRLLSEQRSISMVVDLVAISFCDIVQFTPWCGSQTPDKVVEALNFMFNLFDDRLNKYKTMTKIKCIGDCYMCAAGIFTPGVSPSVFGSEMTSFGLDLVDAIGIVNENLGTSLRVRIGVALGGPISAGVMGIHKPVFDIWGECVNESNGLESSGIPMKVHINKMLSDVIDHKQFYVEDLKQDGTFFVSPFPDENAE